MKPRNATQQRILRMSQALAPISKAQADWARLACHSHSAIDNGRTKCCTGCGTRFKSEAKEGEAATCPECGCRLTVRSSKRQAVQEDWYFSIGTTCGGYQVVRNCIATRKIRRKGMEFAVNEVSQNWVSAKGQETTLGRKRFLCFLYERWSYDSPMEIRQMRRGQYTSNYECYHPACDIYPRSKVLPVAKRNGYRVGMGEMPMGTAVAMVLSDPIAELVAKHGQHGLLKHLHQDSQCVAPHCIKVALRHGYKINDASLWIDYVRLLEWHNLDTHSPHYLCPANLKAEHDKLLKRKQRIEAEERRKKLLAEAVKQEDAYRESHGRYFGIAFGDNEIVVTAIASVAEMAEEGEAMRHCVYSMKYYEKPDSLILSARTPEGERLETVELSLKNYKVLQSRAKCNGTHELHKRIVKLVEDNARLIKDAKKRTA